MRDIEYDFDACGTTAFARMIEATPDPPCMDCPNARACASQRLACAQFELYIDSVRTEGNWSFWCGCTPTHRRYARVFSGQDGPQGRRIRRRSHRSRDTRRERKQVARDLRIHYAAGIRTDAELAAMYKLKLPVVRRYRKLTSV